MKVTETYLSAGTQSMLTEPLYSVHIVGLYIIISIPLLGLTVIWDKHTRLTIQLESQWRVRRNVYKIDIKSMTVRLDILSIKPTEQLA